MKFQYKQLLLLSVLLIFSLTYVSANCDWATYGNSFSPNWNEQISPVQCYGRFQLGGINTLTSLSGLTIAGVQPLVSNLDSVSVGDTSGKLIVINGNYLQILDSNLNVESERLINGTVTGQPTILEFGTGKNNNIAFISKINSTFHQLQVYSFNRASSFLNLSYVFDITTPIDPVYTKLRGVGERISFLMQNNATSSNFMTFNNSGLQSSVVVNNMITNGVLSNWDMDNDGVEEYLTHDGVKYVVFKSTGVVMSSNTISGIANVRMYPICFKQWYQFFTSCNVEWSIGVMTHGTTVEFKTYRLSGALIWTKTLYSGGFNQKGVFAIQDDYNGDGFVDLYTVYTDFSTSTYVFNILSGKDGTTLYGIRENPTPTPLINTLENYLSLVDINHNGKYDFVYVNYNKMWIVDPLLNSSIINSSFGTVGGGGSRSTECIPADLNFDGYQEVICSSLEGTIMYSSNTTNFNVNSISIAVDPSVNIVLGQTLNIFITASDIENNQLDYVKSCFLGDNLTSTSSVTSCVYTSVGIYNVTIGVKDIFHSDYIFNSFLVTVSETGQVCNNNAVCESGESNSNCPSDCSIVNQTQTTTGNTQIGGMNLPTEIVSATDNNKGLLPEIYYGILGFLSGTLTPIIILISVIFFTLIIFTLATIIKKFFEKIGH